VKAIKPMTKTNKIDKILVPLSWELLLAIPVFYHRIGEVLLSSQENLPIPEEVPKHGRNNIVS
jgi:hypothetical protein